MTDKNRQNHWLVESRDTINARIKRGIAQLDRGEGIPEDKLDAYLASLKSLANQVRRQGKRP